MTPKTPSAVEKALGNKSLWPFYAILLIALFVILGRGFGGSSADDRAGTSGTTASASSSASPTTSRAAGGGTSTTRAGGGAATPTGTTRGPFGDPVTATDRSIAVCSVDHIPAEARRTLQLIRAGGPFPYPRNDGVTFRNSEGRLPKKAADYYREYTVTTPGSPDRGTRRIITGGDPATNPPEWFYTDDHYETFCKLTGL